MRRPCIFFLCLTVLYASAPLLAADNQPVDTEKGWPWGIHMITIPLVLLFGIVIGWTLHERKVSQEDARREVAEKKAASDKAK